MTEATQQPEVPTARVATRPGASGVVEHRRRLYQRHVLIFLAVNIAVLAADLYTSPGTQFFHFLAAPWFLLFLLHSVALKSRGYSVGELLIPPREKPVKEVYTTPLDYEVVRARQLRDGLANAAAAVRRKNAALADDAVAAADQLVSAVEVLVAAARSEKYQSDRKAIKLVPEAQGALDALDQLHQELIRIEVLEESPEESSEDDPVQPVRERTEALRKLSE